MSNPAHRQLHAALSHDLNKTTSRSALTVFDDAPRKTFTAHDNGAVLEFAHKQPDNAFWTGVKHYSSGKRSNIRLPRTKVEPAVEAPVETP